ncbi:hypothetical protein K2173_012076 [Erythroxylum novogranatense]|uniref:U-box domain-containing protein n=1 Tax=Erythroxylum novogranatense TaxID=1862640 RepID=A0AAV8TGQ5_9ROSI|nr:hypothetical protein K2173_012076 [Erythroxylum novogranatense]
MVRDLCITIPSFFRCPISFDVMTSPVSLCTGVTYDRASIQRWLDSGNNTCPATMQVLHTKEFVPNRTLQRLIQIWSESVLHNRRVDSGANSVPSRDEVESIVKGLRSSNREAKRIVEVLSKILCFAKESEENREFLASREDLVPMLIGFLADTESVSDIELIEELVRILDIILPKIGGRKKELMTLLLKKRNDDKDNSNGLYSLLFILQQGKSLDSRIGSIRVLEAVAVDAESKLIISETDGLLPELTKSICLESDPCLIEAALSCLIAISMSKRVKTKLVHLKTVTELRKLLKSVNMSVSITEKAMKVLEMVTSCGEGREEMCKDEECVEAVVEKMLKVTAGTTEHAVTVLWSVCYLFRDRRAQEVVTRMNGLTKILLLMQSNCSPAVRQMAADLLKIFRVNSKSCLSSYDTKTTHIMPF